MISFEPSTFDDRNRGQGLEWLETNGLGGYAMGTVGGAHTRRYHGLLCAAVRPPVDRRMLINKLEEVLHIDGAAFELGCNLYGNVVHPQGYRLISGFRLDPWPVWTFGAGGAQIEKHVLMPHGRNAIVVAYRCLSAPGPVTIKARVLASWRDHHHLGRARLDLGLQAEATDHAAVIGGPGGHVVAVEMERGHVWPDNDWYYGLTYPAEAERGLDALEDLLSILATEWTVQPGQTAGLVACLGEPLGMSIEQAMQSERERREAVAAGAPEGDPVARQLFLAADQFVVERPVRDRLAKSVIAGYPWFTDWGRDTMISLPGLLLTTGRYADARDVLIACAETMQDGLVPNLFPDQTDEAAYNTVDATLWFFASARRYYDSTRDLGLFRDLLFGKMRQSLSAHIEGTRFGIRVDDDGLLMAGDAGTQLTWMDAKVGDWVVTPRHGKAVEINALWYSALRTAEFFARKLGKDASIYGKLCRRVKENFGRTFWLEEPGYLADCVREDFVDSALRPNQLIALCLPYTLLSQAQERSVLLNVGEQLLTPYGLRTLSPLSDGYCGRYQGDQWARDGAYHQGTVWTWPLGAFLQAYLSHAGRSQQAREWVRGLIAPLIAHLSEAGLGTVSEIFDGDAPHTPRGCPAQAWSVAELLRVWVQFGLGEREEG